MNYDWSNITLDEIKKLMKDNYEIYYNNTRLYTDGAEDQIILAFKN